MNQIATVVRMTGPATAEVKVVRQGACAHNCTECAGCGVQSSSITVLAECDFSVSPGDRVELYSDNRVLGYAALVYLVPLALFLLAYLIVPTASETIRGICGGAGFGLGVVLAVLCDRLVRRKNSVKYRIVRKM